MILFFTFKYFIHLEYVLGEGMTVGIQLLFLGYYTVVPTPLPSDRRSFRCN